MCGCWWWWEIRGNSAVLAPLEPHSRAACTREGISSAADHQECGNHGAEGLIRLLFLNRSNFSVAFLSNESVIWTTQQRSEVSLQWQKLLWVTLFLVLTWTVLLFCLWKGVLGSSCKCWEAAVKMNSGKQTFQCVLPLPSPSETWGLPYSQAVQWLFVFPVTSIGVKLVSHGWLYLCTAGERHIKFWVFYMSTGLHSPR